MVGFPKENGVSYFDWDAQLPRTVGVSPERILFSEEEAHDFSRLNVWIGKIEIARGPVDYLVAIQVFEVLAERYVLKHIRNV